jgi:hypothetical protein
MQTARDHSIRLLAAVLLNGPHPRPSRPRRTPDRRFDLTMAQRNPRGTKPPSRADTARAHGVLLEQLGSQMNMVLEAVSGAEQRLDAKIDSAVAQLSDRISVLEEVVRKHSGDIRALGDEVAGLRNEVAGLRDEVAGLRGEVTGLRHDFDHRQELGRVGALEARVSAIESRLAVSR